MKKLIALLLALVMCLSLCACGGKSNEVELTSENYATYLNISSSHSHTGTATIMMIDGGKSPVCYPEASGVIKVVGVSSNYDYNNLVIKVKATATYDTYTGSIDSKRTGTSTDEVTISCDIAGNGSESFTIFNDTSCKVDVYSINIDWEVVSISGTAVRVG